MMQRRIHKTRFSRSALALVAVLWVAALMMALVSVAAQTSLLDSRVSQIENEKQRGRWACRAGVETAIALLLEDDRTYDGLTDLWADNPQELQELDFGGVTVNIEVIDAASRLNVNTAALEQLLYLPDMTEDVADSILDWIDSDDTIRTSGAESGYYLNLDHSYWSRNGRVRTIRELLRVKGVSEGLFYGDSKIEPLSVENEGWINYLTCVSQEQNVDSEGNRRINVNRVGESTLRDELGLSPGQTRWIMENRSFSRLGDLIGQSGSGNSGNSGNSGGSQQGASRQTSTQSSNQTSTQSSNGSSRSSGSSQSSGRQQQQEQPPAEPLNMTTVLGLADKITLTGRSTIRGKININTADLIVLTAFFEGNRELAQNLIAAREGMGGVFLEFTDLQQVEGMTQDILTRFLDQMTIRSSIFEIHVTAASQATGLTYCVEAIVNRDTAEGQILYWREGIGR